MADTPTRTYSPGGKAHRMLQHLAATPSRVEDLTPAQRDALAAFLRRVAGGEIRSDAFLATRDDFDGWRLATRLGFLDDGHAGSPLFSVTDAGRAFLRTVGGRA